ncbi:MAG TPA: hypothetical protein DCW29_08610 [Janthinobacterium sp.]|nr:hypothetical protein [Janthinobacterium sp.]
MNAQKQDYRGYTIAVTAAKDHDDLWDFEYHIAKDDATVALKRSADVTRSQTMGGHATPDVARLAGWEVAKTEVDNLLALDEK